MKNLIYKEVKLAISPLFFILPILLGLLMFIPEWIFTLVFMYFFWISAPQIYSAYIAKQDFSFSMMLPISKKEYVKSKIYALYIIEGLHIFCGFFFGIIHNLLYGKLNWFFDINIAFFGMILVLFTLFNILFLPLYFRTGYFWGRPLIIGIAATMIFGFIIEWSAVRYEWFRSVFEGSLLSQTLAAALCILLTIILNSIALKRSVSNYESSL